MGRDAKRVEWIDVAKFICIVSVIVSHLESNTAFLSAIYQPFFLSMFFFSSGYVYRQKSGFKEFLIRKVRGLFVPWLLFSVCNILLSQILSFNKHEALAVELTWNFLQIRGKGDEVWFVAALFAAYIPFYFLIDSYQKQRSAGEGKPTVLLMSFLTVMYICSVIYSACMDPSVFPWNSTALPWHVEYIPQALLFMAAGYLFRIQYENAFDRKVSVRKRYTLVLLYLLAATVPLGQLQCLPAPVLLVYEHLMKAFGILVMTGLCKQIPTNWFVLFVGRNTLIYFALHGKVYSLGQTVLKKIMPDFYGLILENWVLSSVFAIVFAVMICVILIVPAWVINRWIPFAVGRKTRK